jgi:hypothetical protein
MDVDEYGYPIETPLEKFTGSPGFAMAMQSLQNIALGQSGQRETVSPFSAMYDVRKQNQLLMDRKFAYLEQRQRWKEGQALRDAQLQAANFTNQTNASAVPNPYQNLPTEVQEWELSGAKSRGVPYEKFLESKSPHYFAPTQPTSVMQNFAMWRQLNPGASAEEQQAAFNNLARPSQVIGMGGGGQMSYNPLTGRPNTIVDPQSATDLNANAEGEKQTAKDWAKTNADFGATAPQAHSALNLLYNTTMKMRDALEDPEIASNTGLLQGHFGGYVSEQTAYLETLANIATLPALKDAGLAPVTGTDVAMIRSTFTDLLRDPIANNGAIKAQIELLEQKIKSSEKAINYYNKHGGDMSKYLQSTFTPIDVGGRVSDGLIDDSDAPPL